MRLTRSEAEQFGIVKKSKTRNKYGVSRPEERTWNGRTYASKAEMRYAQHLYRMRDRGEIIEVIEQPSLWLGVPENKYRPDFFVVESSGACHYHDVKGVETPEFRRVRKLWAAYGRLPLVVIFAKGTSWKTEIIESPPKTPIVSTVTRPESDSAPSPESDRT